MRNGVRIFVSLWYLLGWTAHVYLGIFAPEIYRPFGKTALLPTCTNIWVDFIMPYITVWTFTLAAFEILVGILIVSKGSWVKAGLILSILFNIFLVQLGLGYSVNDGWQSFLVNRLPNIVFILIQAPLLWGQDQRSIPEVIRTRFGVWKHN